MSVESIIAWEANYCESEYDFISHDCSIIRSKHSIIQQWTNVLQDDWSHAQKIYFSRNFRFSPQSFNGRKPFTTVCKLHAATRPTHPCLHLLFPRCPPHPRWGVKTGTQIELLLHVHKLFRPPPFSAGARSWHPDHPRLIRTINESERRRDEEEEEELKKWGMCLCQLGGGDSSHN